jgi:hypothetical protein
LKEKVKNRIITKLESQSESASEQDYDPFEVEPTQSRKKCKRDRRESNSSSDMEAGFD